MFIWTITDAISIALFVIVVLAVVPIYLGIWWRQRRCKHDGRINETRSCDAICAKCGKNLGFIGAWRATHQEDHK